MSVFSIEKIGEQHIEDAAKLFAEQYRIEREHMPLLPSRYECDDAIVPLLSEQIKKTPGVVAIEKGTLAGYLIGRPLSLWRGKRSAFVPFWAHTAKGHNRKNLYQQMYTHISSEWIKNGCFTHLISVLAHDEEITHTLFWLGFGMVMVDAMRGFDIIQDSFPDVTIRTATRDDIEMFTSLHNALARFLAGSPIFFAMTEKRERDYHKKWLSEPLHKVWLASINEQVVAYMKICPLNEDYMITDKKTAWIQGAFTHEPLRDKGIGTALLKQALKWAQSEGFARCAVDFESENVLASRFWLRYFTPVCYSLARHIDKRIAWAHKDRDDKHFW